MDSHIPTFLPSGDISQEQLNEIWNTLSSSSNDFDLINANSVETCKYFQSSINCQVPGGTAKNYNTNKNLINTRVKRSRLNKMKRCNSTESYNGSNLLHLDSYNQFNKCNLNPPNEYKSKDSESFINFFQNMSLNDNKVNFTADQCSAETVSEEDEIKNFLSILEGYATKQFPNDIISPFDDEYELSFDQEEPEILSACEDLEDNPQSEFKDYPIEINMTPSEYEYDLIDYIDRNTSEETHLDEECFYNILADNLQLFPPKETSSIESNVESIYKNSNNFLVQQCKFGTTYFYNSEQNYCYKNNIEGSKYVQTPSPEPPLNIQTDLSRSDSPLSLSDNVPDNILERNQCKILKTNSQKCTNLPNNVDIYHDLELLEDDVNVTSSMYRATHSETGEVYCLRRLHLWKLTNRQCTIALKAWKKIVHPNIVQIHEAFTTNDFGDNSMIFVYDFYPAAETMYSRYFLPLNNDPFLNSTNEMNFEGILRTHIETNKLPEDLLWDYIIQISSALWELKTNSLTCRTLDPTKIIITDGNRIKLSCTGISDIAQKYFGDDKELLEECQQDQLTSFGKLILALACKSIGAANENVQNLAKYLIQCYYSNDLYNLLTYLLNTMKFRKISSITSYIGFRFYNQTNKLYNNCDYLESELSKSFENDRLFRLITKLIITMVNRKTGSSVDESDHNLLELFRNYVFKQNNGQNKKNLGYIVQCLNKLDYGHDEIIQLTSKDESDLILVTYQEIKHSLNCCFNF